MTWVACILVTLSVIASPATELAHANPSLHLALDAVDMCIALLVAYLLHNRFARRHRLQDWLLCVALVIFGLAGLVVTTVIEEVMGIRDGRLNVWLPLALRVIGAVLILVAALVGDRPGPGRLRYWSVAAPVLLILVVGAVLWALDDSLPVAVPPDRAAEVFDRSFAGHPLLLAGLALSAACFLIASLIVTRQAARSNDELLRWLAPASAVAGFARVNYLLYPTLYTDWLYTGDLLRTAGYALLLVGGLRELRVYWGAQAHVAVIEDRRRLARELHDGLLQELTYIRVASSMLPEDTPTKGEITDAAVRALDEARAAVNSLGSLDDEPLGFVLHRAARELAERYDVDFQVDVDDSIIADADQRHALMRIVREAVVNAVRHGGARTICVRLSQLGDTQRLTIEDDGAGFAVHASGGAGGYGLVSMRTRAKDLPGTLRIDSTPGEGTIVTVTW
ncbi:ATP-binding protein [Agromyces aurantiacus]|uniref:histidine kinase n=1 Tax=Agromyces aurantiacus TaxID=165814 RepID=A0ABV9R428_9MICO|nr:ATP-binding protein [Agromyces aurantiacus]MBM7503573.1 signal transduction histidine kinase [Agromyces aurantiacus]